MPLSSSAALQAEVYVNLHVRIYNHGHENDKSNVADNHEWRYKQEEKAQRIIAKLLPVPIVSGE